MTSSRAVRDRSSASRASATAEGKHGPARRGQVAIILLGAVVAFSYRMRRLKGHAHPTRPSKHRRSRTAPIVVAQLLRFVCGLAAVVWLVPRIAAPSRLPDRRRSIGARSPSESRKVEPTRNDQRLAPSIPNLFKSVGRAWRTHKTARLGAALAYYTVFSLAPVMFVAVSVAALFIDREVVMQGIDEQLQGFIGKQAAHTVEDLMNRAHNHEKDVLATVVGVVVLMFGASGVFGQLQDALNTVWEVRPKADRGILGMLKDRFWSLAAVLGTGFVLLVSLITSAFISGLGSSIGGRVHGSAGELMVLSELSSWLVITIFFALIFKLLPDAKIAWSDVAVGAAGTAFLFTVGKHLFGLYLGHGGVSTTYGAAAAVIIVFLWAYYSSQILLLGAEFTRSYALLYGSRIRPADDAELIATAAES